MKEKKYQINSNFIMRKIVGEYVIIPVGENNPMENAMMTPNSSAVFLWNEFQTARSIDEVVERCLEEFEADKDEIRQDVTQFVVESLHCGIMEEYI